jgi:NAD(P)-dependent dehydrogenase (short-subunit alcohol dehydrogenase family)
MAFYNASKWAVSGFTEALASELSPFNVAVTAVEPGMFRTAFLNAGKRTGTARRLEEVYAGTGVEEYRRVLDGADGTQLGDVKVGARVVVDVLTKTGVAEGREIPLRVVLGSDCLQVIRDKCESTLKLLDEWEDISTSTDHQN